MPGTEIPDPVKDIGFWPWFFGVGLNAGLGGSTPRWGWADVADANLETRLIRLMDSVNNSHHKQV